MKSVDICGKKFNRLTPLNKEIRYGRVHGWICLCDCGNITWATSNHLRIGKVKSCGCLYRETKSTKNIKHGRAKRAIKHDNTYSTWESMMSRCYCKSSSNYKNYGKRGICVSNEWHKFETFLNDMGERPVGMSLERIDVNKGYSVENCKWATRLEQARNKTTSLRILFDGIERACSEIAEIVGLSDETLRRWIHNGMTESEIKSSVPEALKRRARAIGPA